MNKSPYLKKNKPSKQMSEENRRKQKFAIWNFFIKKEQGKTDTPSPTKTTKTTKTAKSTKSIRATRKKRK